MSVNEQLSSVRSSRPAILSTPSRLLSARDRSTNFWRWTPPSCVSEGMVALLIDSSLMAGIFATGTSESKPVTSVSVSDSTGSRERGPREVTAARSMVRLFSSASAARGARSR